MIRASEPMNRLVGLRHLFSRLFPQTVSLDFSVAIPTYNGSQRLAMVLECLRWQINTYNLSWEIIVVDNNSTDDTATTIKRCQQEWGQHIPLVYAFEPRQGAAYARQTAVSLAKSPIIGFLDDDTLPAMTWLTAAYQFTKEYPQAGVIASRIRGDFETSPPDNFERIAALLALTERGSKALQYAPRQRVIPPSAGVVVRRQAWLENVPTELVLVGRTGTSMLAGEDTESLLYIQRAGWEVWYNPKMRLQHKIPSARLTRQYLQKLCRGIGLSRCRTRMLSTVPWQRPIMFCLYVGNDLRKILSHCLHYRRKVISDDVTSCELMLYTTSLISPLFMAQRSLRQHIRRWAHNSNKPNPN